MKIFAISDLHMSNSTNKPMDIFGEKWVGHLDQIKEDWEKKVSEEDVVLIGGDISWAMNILEAKEDVKFFSTLPGKKVLIKGNHD